MRSLPTRGRCHAIFLLAFSARVRTCRGVNEWVLAALDKPTHMAASLDLSGTANLLLDVGLAKDGTSIYTANGLEKLDREADLATLKSIAHLLLRHRPPGWLRAVLFDGRFTPDFIPQRDLEAIAWLGGDLEEIITSAHKQVYGVKDEHLLKQLGDAGELAIMSALRREGHNPRHVSLISDRFGYDIEHSIDHQTFGLEIKSAVKATAVRALISRNEFEVAKRMGKRWKLIQVTFSSRVIANGRASIHDIEMIRELPSHSLVALAPVEKEGFRWTEAAEFRPSTIEWKACNLQVGSDFEAPITSNKE